MSVAAPFASAQPASAVLPLSRRWLWMVTAVALALSIAASPGQISPDTKLDLTANPLRFLSRATNLWNSELPFGQAQNQAYGYLFPHGTFFLAGHLLGLPGWITQRLWWALLLTIGFWGLLRVAEALGIGSPTSRVIAAAAFALSPRVLTTLGSISSETLPIMLAPWVLLPTILALRSDGRSVRRLAGQAGVAVALMGAVNAIATLAGCLPAVIWWACHRPNRRWWRYSAWWLPALALAMSWWLVALILMARISPPFLDFIESSRVTTQWSSLVEVLRGTDSWTPFVAPNATAGAPLVNGSVAILATCLVAAAGLAGLAMEGMPARGRLVTMLLVGVVLLGAGYSGGLGSPLAQHVQAFLDAGGAPLRNVHKLGSLVRIPIVLGLAQLLGRIPLPGSAPKPVWVQAFAHPERDKRVAAGIVVLTALMAGTSLAWSGRITPPGTFSAIPRYWHDAADWLSAHNTGAPPGGRVLVVPGAPFATQLWGTSHDEPLQVLGNSPWGVRDSIPLTPPQTIRALDSVQRLFAAGRPSAGLADTLARQGISYVVLRNDLDPDTSRSARPILVHRTIAGSPRLQKVAQFGAPVGPGPVSGFVTDSGLRPRYPAVEIYRVAAAAVDPAAPYLADIDQLARVDGGPEVLMRLDERRRLSGQPPLGPVLMTADAVRARLPIPAGAGVTVTDTPLARETDYGRVDDHSSAIRAAGDARHTFNRVPDYPTPGAETVYGAWTGGRLTASSSSSDATALPDVAPAASPAAAIDGDSATAWVSNGLQSAVGQWLQVDFDRPVTNSVITITPSATAVGAQVRRIEIETATGTTTLRFDEAGKPLTAALPYGETSWVRITAIATDDGSAGVQFAITDLSITQYDASGFAHPVDVRHTALVPAPPPNAAVAQWDLGSEPLGRPGCAMGPKNMQCAASMALAPETPATFSRTLSVPQPVSVLPTVWVRARSGPKLADLLAEPDTTRARGDSDLVDVLGSAYAATDGDPATAWTAPQRVVQHKTPPTLTLTLPRPTEVTGLRLTPSRSSVPAHPTMVAVDLGDGPQVRTLSTSGPQNLPLKSRVTDTVTVSLLDWEDVIDRTALGFDQLKPPGLAEIAALGADGRPIAAADAARNRAREITVDCAARAGHRDRRPVCAHRDPFDGGRIAGRRAGDRASLRPAADHAADRSAGVVDQSGAAIRHRRRGIVRSARSPIAHRRSHIGDAGIHRGMGSGPPRSAHSRRDDIAGVGRAGKPQHRVGGTHQRRDSADAGGRQRLAAGVGGAGGNIGHHHADLCAQLAVPRGPGRRAGAAAAVGPDGVVAAAASAPRRPRCAPVGARALGRCRGADGRGGDRRCGGRAGVRCRSGPAVGAARPSAAARRDHRGVERRWADPGRRGAVPASVAIGRRLRRPFGRRATACAHFACGAGRVGDDADRGAV